MLRLELPRDPDAPAAARHALDRLPPSIDSDRRADARLLVSELVTNSVLHGRGEEVAVLADADERGTLRCEVIDDGAGFEPVARPVGQAIGGWGLHLVDQLATDWGVYASSTHVWFELAPPPPVPLATAR